MNQNNKVGLYAQGGNNNNRVRNKFKGNCNLCGRQGHKKTMCWEDPSNSDKRPQGWKSILKKNDSDDSDNDQANAASDSCPLCGKKGHDISKCFYNPFNPSNKLKDPELCQPCIDRGDNEDSDKEVGFTALSVPKTLDWTEPTNNPSNFKAYTANHVKRSELDLYFPNLRTEEIRGYVWIADSGASTYMYFHDKGFTNCQKNNTKVEVGEGSTTRAPKIGKWHGAALDARTGKTLKVCLNKTLLVLGLMNNLFSLTQSMANGCKFYSYKDNVRVDLPGGKGVIAFDKKIKTRNGSVLASILKPAEPKGKTKEFPMPARVKK